MQAKLTLLCCISGRIGLQIPDISRVLPLSKAQELMASYEKKEVEFIYKYWQDKRNEVGKPLLERICDQFPWNVGHHQYCHSTDLSSPRINPSEYFKHISHYYTGFMFELEYLT